MVMGARATWDGWSTGPDNASLTVTVPVQYPSPPPGSMETAVATASTSVLVIAPYTTYTMTLAANVNGYASGYMFFVDDIETITGKPVSGGVPSWRNYTNSFTIGGLTNKYVGQNLYAQIEITQLGTQRGTSTAAFTNIQLTVTDLRPSLSLRSTGPAQAQLRWSTNFPGAVLESSADLLADPWQQVTNVPTLQSNEFILPLSLQAGQRFFRLRVE
jgi:hypothetical protein